MKTAPPVLPEVESFRSPPVLGGRVRLGLLLVWPALAFGSAITLSAEEVFSFTIEPGSETWVSIPVHPPVAFDGEVAGVEGNTVTFTQRFCEPECAEVSPFEVVSVSDRVTVMTGAHAGVRGRVLWSDDRSVVIDTITDVSGISPGDRVRIVPGWSLASIFPAATPDGTQVLVYGPRPRGINLAASEVYEYVATEGFWFDLVTGKPADEVVIREAETFLVRDPRDPGGTETAYELVMTGEVSGVTPRVDLAVRPQNAPQEIHFGVTETVALGESGLGASGDRLYVLPESNGTTPVAMYVYFAGFGWFEGAANVDHHELEPGRGYIYRRVAPEPRDVVSTFSLLVRQGNFRDHLDVPVPEGAAFGIVVDTTGNGFNPNDFPPFPAFVPGDRAVFLPRPDGAPTGVALVYAGAFSGSGFIGGATGIRHATGGGVAETGDRWGILWFPRVPAGGTPKAWQGFGFYTNENMVVPAPGRTLDMTGLITAEPKRADWVPLTPVVYDTFDAWTVAHFYPDERADPARTEPAGDPERFGVANLLRYAFDLDPRRPLVMGGLPEVTIEIPAGESELFQSITYQRFLDASDVEYRVQVSEDLENWNDLDDAVDVSVESVPGERHQRITVRDPQPVGTDGGRFMRVQVSQD